MTERLNPGFAVFNLHLNDAGDRAMKLLDEFAPTLADEIRKFDKKGIMSIFNEEPTQATSAYSWLVTAFVNEDKADAPPREDLPEDDGTYNLTGCEAEAHKMRDAVRKIERMKDNNWSTTELIIADAMLACWNSERTREEWMQIACAMHNMTLDEEWIGYAKRAFRNLVRAGFVYGRQAKGGRHYGINFGAESDD